MVLIVNGCRKESDILEKKAKFLSFLENKKITTIERHHNTDEYIIENNEIIKKLEEDSFKSGKTFDITEATIAFSHLTVVNAYRKGRSNCSFNSAKYFFVTDKSLTNFIAFNPVVKFNEHDIPLSTTIDHLTTTLWFSLNKSFSHGKKIITFDVMVRAKLALESQLNDAISECYHEIKRKLGNGEISTREAEQLYSSLREKSIRPEEITEDDAYKINIFCSNDKIRELQEERVLFNQKIKNAEQLEQKLKYLFTINLSRKAAIIKQRYRMAYAAILLSSLLCFILAGYFLCLTTDIFPSKFSDISNGVIANMIFLTLTSGVWYKKVAPKLKSVIRKKYTKRYSQLRNDCKVEFLTRNN